jgi:hypothetical protein
MMMKRTPRRMENASAMWSAEYQHSTDESIRVVVDSLLNESKISAEAHARFIARMAHLFGPEIPDDIRLRSMLLIGPAARTLRRMRWTLLIAPPFVHYLTCDNPVWWPKEMGLKQPNFEMSFPISSNVALLVSWHRDLPEGIKFVSSRIVGIINHRSIMNVTHQAYYSVERQDLSIEINSQRGACEEIYPLLSSH